VLSAAVHWEQNIAESGCTGRVQLVPYFIPVKVLVFHRTLNVENTNIKWSGFS